MHIKGMMTKVLGLSLLTFSLQASAIVTEGPVQFSSNQEKMDYFSIGSVEVEEITDSEFVGELELYPHAEQFTNQDGKQSSGDFDLSEIINLGKKIWAVIEKNKPVVNIKVDKATALPKGAKSWNALSGWQSPKTKVFKMTYKNNFGMKVVEFAYRVNFTYGGNVDGIGAYIARATVVPAYLDVAWGYKFGAFAKVPNVLNVGNKTRPIGAAELEMVWTVDTVMKHHQMSTNYFVTGEGSFEDLTNGN